MLKLLSSRLFSSSSGGSSSDPIGKLFFNPQVQETLTALTGCKHEKIFRLQKKARRTEKPRYQFMTDEQLKKAQQFVDDNAKALLQMPPVMSERSNEVFKSIEEDPELVGFDAAKYVFTDISPGFHNRERIIVTRHPNGSLRQATW